MTASDPHRCRWWTDGPSGRCLNPQQFPGMRDVPPFCAEHLRQLEPWVTARAAQRGGSAPEWIAWAQRRAAASAAGQRLLGERDGLPGPVRRRHTARTP